MLENTTINAHSSIRIGADRVIYFDPFKIEDSPCDADIIFITHDHYDHFSPEDLQKVMKEGTKLVYPATAGKSVAKLGLTKSQLYPVKPNETLTVDGIPVETVPAYNNEKPFHPKRNQWVGYILTLDDDRIYIAGDTDLNRDVKQLDCDIAFVPVGGTYTMNTREAAKLVNFLRPKIAVPTHYGSIVGEPEDGEDFASRLDSGIEAKILIK